MQVVIARTIEIDPTLDRGALRPALTVTVSVVEPLAGTITLAGTVIRSSPGVMVPAFQIRGTVFAEGTRSEFALRDHERLVSAGRVV